jgi:hypothetical protein
VFDDSFSNAQRQIQSPMSGIALLKVLYDSQRMQVVVEASAMPLQAPVESPFAGMAKRRMTDVVHQRQRLRKSFIQPQNRCRSACNLGHLNRVRQPASKMIRRTARKDLRLSCQPPEGSRLHNAFPIPLKRGPAETRWNWIHTRNQRIGFIAGNGAMPEVLCHSLP